jgi:hypothetical protein
MAKVTVARGGLARAIYQAQRDEEVARQRYGRPDPKDLHACLQWAANAIGLHQFAASVALEEIAALVTEHITNYREYANG